MFVAASSRCFPDLSFGDMIGQLVDLEYTAVDLAVHEQGGHLKPSEVHADLNRAIQICRSTRRITLCAMSVEIEADEEEALRQFTSCCKLAKAAKVVAISIPSSELGTPFNAEVERLRAFVSIASMEGVLVGVQTKLGQITHDPDTTIVMCEHVHGLGVTLDPSHYIYDQQKTLNFEPLIKYVYHVHLRDSTLEKWQVRVGQGDVEYRRLVSQLTKVKYDRVLSVHIVPMEGVDHHAEMRKMRLLLESLL